MLWNLFESCGIELQSTDHLFLLSATSNALIVAFTILVNPSICSCCGIVALSWGVNPSAVSQDIPLFSFIILIEIKIVS